MPELNIISTSATDTTGSKGQVSQPYYGTTVPGYNYGGANNPTGDGILEWGSGTPGSLPFQIDQAGNVTTTGTVTSAGGGGAVASVFGRTGAVTAQTGDYTAAQVGADASGAAATAQTNAEAYTDTVAALKAPLASAALTGTPTAPTAAALTNSTQLSTTAYTDLAVGVETTRALAAEAALVPATRNWAPADSGLIAWTADPASFGSGQVQLAASTGTCWGTAMIVNSAATISKVSVVLSTLGSGLTTGESFIVFYNQAGTLLGYSADQSAVWETGGATGLKVTTLTAQSAGSLTLTAGKYWFGMYSVGSVTPKFMGGSGTPYFGAINTGGSGNAARAAQLFTGATTQGTIPTSGITFTAGGGTLWGAIS